MSNNQKHINEIASTIAMDKLGAPLTEIRLIQGRGEVNQAYEIITSLNKAILRVNDYAEFERFKKEEWCIKQAQTNSIPTPKCLFVGSDKECSYSLIEYISGDNGQVIKDTNDTWYVLGKLLHQIHSIPVSGFGDNLSDITDGNKAQWHIYIKDNIRALKSGILFEKELLTSTQVNKLISLFKDLLNKDFEFGLNHGDYSLANIIISNDGTHNIIDWGSAQAHVVPHHDLAVIMEESLSEKDEKYSALLSGYGTIRQDYEDIKEEIRVLQLLDAFDKLRWAMDNAPNWIEHHSLRLMKFVKKAEL